MCAAVVFKDSIPPTISQVTLIVGFILMNEFSSWTKWAIPQWQETNQLCSTSWVWADKQFMKMSEIHEILIRIKV